MKNPSKNVAEIEALGARLEQWRQTRENHRTRIPEPMWEAAAELARKHGIYAVSRVLRIPDLIGQGFRSKSAGHSGPNRPTIPE